MRERVFGTDPRALSEIVAMLILRTQSDTVSFTEQEQEQLRALFPGGFALVAWGAVEDGALSLKLLGTESQALMDTVADELSQGSTSTIQRLFEGEKRPG